MNGHDDTAEYLTAEQAARVLRVTDRQARRYAADGTVRSKKAGHRVLLHREDVERLAAEQNAYAKPPPQPQIVPQGELIQAISRLQGELAAAAAREAALAERLRLLPAPEEAQELRTALATAQAELAALRAELDRYRAPRPWYTQPLVWLGLALALALVAIIALALL